MRITEGIVTQFNPFFNGNYSPQQWKKEKEGSIEWDSETMYVWSASLALDDSRRLP